MRQYELAIRIAQVHHLVDERKYKKALAVIQTLDMRQVRSLSDLKVFAEVYTKTEQYEAAKATYLRIYRRSRTRRVLYRLIYLSIRTNALEDAEAYYQEFVRMNPNARDALILRYRIDKASGVPIGQLIEILQELKQEEYIEEWAYELAKLYHRAGRREECLEECEDILLWFGTGEIVERAKILIDHLKEKDPIPYYDDKDFTVPKEEEPNPDDTGSLPDIHEFIKERKAQKKDERLAEKAARKAEEYEDEYIEEAEESVSFAADSDKEEQEEANPIDKEDKWEEDTDTFIDDYEEGDFEQDGIDLPQKAKDGIQKLSGLLKLGKKEEEKTPEDTLEEVKKEEKESSPKEMEKKPDKKVEKKSGKKQEEYVPHSQSGTGITQNLAKEISAIYEMEHREQLKEKAVTVINEVPNLATSVVDRMTQAIQKSAGKGYIPLDIEEIQRKNEEQSIQKEEQRKAFSREAAEQEAKQEEEPEAPKDALTRALDAEVEKYYEEKAREKAQKEEKVTTQKSETELLRDLLEEEIVDPDTEEEAALTEESYAEGQQEEKEKPEQQRSESVDENDSESGVSESVEPEESEPEALEAVSPKESEPEISEAVSPEGSEPEVSEAVSPEESRPEVSEAVSPKESEPEVSEAVSPEESRPEMPEAADKESPQERKEDNIEEKASEESVSPLENYHAPEIPVVQTEYMEMPEITYEDLPTTRALQQSFQNVLRLIEGELDPSHFVLMGDGTERIVGVSKQIVRVMKETGYLSKGRIAKIQANQLNKMDLITFRGQLKGNCLLIENAADLLFPTITKIFSIMEEYYGDFVVILADEGTTLDQLFRFVPVLARKFKYIIDISRYTREDYE